MAMEVREQWELIYKKISFASDLSAADFMDAEAFGVIS